jgi:hypothetical protein
LSTEARYAGFTSTVNFLEISTPVKNCALKLWLIPISKENCPIGSLPKSTSIEKINEVVWIYLALIDKAEPNPLTIFTAKTLLQLLLQSLSESNKAFGR